MYEELFHLLSQLGLGAAARALCDLISDLTGESMSLQQLQQEVRNVLKRHGGGDCVDAVVSALVELGFVGRAHADLGENEGAGAAARGPGTAAFSDSAMLARSADGIVANPHATREIHETARGWLDIDGGIYFDVRQHGAGFDPER